MARNVATSLGTPSPDRSRRQRLSAEDRRQILIEATITTLAKHGAQGASLRRACQEAGVAPGLAGYFFDGWQEMVLCAYEALTARFAAQLKIVEQRTDMDGRDRMATAVSLFFSNEWISQRNGDAYIALWALSRTEVDLKARMTVHYADMYETLIRLLSAYLPSERPAAEVSKLADALLIYLNGMWMEMILNPGHVDKDRAIALSWHWIHMFTSAPDTGHETTQMVNGGDRNV